MRILTDHDFLIILSPDHTAADQLLFSCSDRSCSQIKYPGNRSPLCSSVLLLSACYIIGHNPGLTISRPCQRNHRLLSKDRVGNLDHISGSINIRIRCAKLLIHTDSAPFIAL